MKSWPTERQKKQQLLVAVLLTGVAACNGFALLNSFGPFMVLCEIALASCAVLQWSIYFHIQTKLDIKTMMSDQQQDDGKSA